MLGKRIINTGTAACTTDTTQILDGGTTQSIALYRFEDNANDTASGTGKFNKGGVFNGSSSKIYLPNNILPDSSAGSSSASVWFKSSSQNAAANSECILDAYSSDSSKPGWSFFMEPPYGGNPDGHLFLANYSLGGASTGTSASYRDGNWHHAVIVLDNPNNTIKVYLDGNTTTPILSQTASAANVWPFTEMAAIGCQRLSSGDIRYFNGNIDQVRIFNRVLSASEITTLYNETASTINTLQILGDTSCVATYTFEGNANDLDTSTPKNGTASNVTYDYNGTESSITYVTGKFDKALSFSGASSNIETTLSPSNFTFDYSISFWVKLTNANTFQNFVGNYQNSPYGGFTFMSRDVGSGVYRYGFIFWYNSGTYYNYVDNNDVLPTSGQWAHLAVTKSSNALPILYVNGTANSLNYRNAVTDHGTTSQNFKIGNTLNPNYSAGLIDQVRVFDTALSPGEVNSLYNETATTAALGTITNPSTIAYYKMADAIDETGSYDGTASNVDFNVQGKYGFAAKFNGSNSKIALNKAAFINLKNNFSYSLWFNSSVTNMSTLFSHLGNNTPKYGVFLNHSSDTSQSIRFFYSKGSNSQGTQSSSTNIWNVGQWHHLVITKSSTDGLKGYLDNTQIITDATLTDDFTPYTPQNGNSNIGIYQYQTSGGELYQFNGKIDQVRIFNKAISATEVATLYNEIQCANLITAPESYFNTKLWTGDGNARSITGIGFNPDFVWIKKRANDTKSHRLFDSVRGANNVIYSDLTNDADTPTNELTAFVDGGFSLGNASAVNDAASDTYVSWNWKAGGILNQSASFNGSNSLISTGHTAPTSTAASISFWVNIAAYTNYGAFVGDSTGQSRASRFFLGQGSGTSGKLWVSLGDGTTQWYDDTTVSLASYGLNNWFHLVGTVDGTSVKIYINGSLIHTFTSSISYAGAGSGQYYFGGWGNSLHFNGKMDQVRFFNRAILDSEVTTLYNETSSTINTLQVLGDTSCVAAFPLGANANDLNTNNTSSSAANVTFNNPGHLHRNNNGTIGSEVSASPESGFSIVKYKGNGTVGSTVGHGLSAKPEFILFKNLDSNVSWIAYDTVNNVIGYLDLTDTLTDGRRAWAVNNTDPTSTVVTLGNNQATNDTSNFIMYCFHSVDGYQRVGSFIGNGSANGPFIYTGFEPAWVIIKNTDTAYRWYMLDNKRCTTNPNNARLFADANSIEATNSNVLNFHTNGFELITSDAEINKDGDKIIFIAIAANPDSTVPTKANSFKTVLYTGNGDTANDTLISGVGFKPDLVWAKSRNDTYNHLIMDSVRGTTSLTTHETTNERTNYGRFVSYEDNGFKIRANNAADLYKINRVSTNYVSWNWKALDHDRNLAAINNDGSIKSLVSANQNAGFSIVKYTSTGTNGSTVGHGLSSAPDIVFFKCTSTTGTNWITSITNIISNKYLYLNNDGSGGTGGFSIDGTNITLNNTYGDANTNNRTYVAYCWHTVAGYSKIGTYTISSSSDRIITSLGFTPSWVMIKRTDNSGNWVIFDSARGDDDDYLYANTNAIEGTTGFTFSLDTDGFTVGTATWIGGTGGTYLYMAFS